MNKTPVIETHTNNLQNQSSHVKCYRRKKLSQQDQDTKESTNYTIAATYDMATPLQPLGTPQYVIVSAREFI